MNRIFLLVKMMFLISGGGVPRFAGAFSSRVSSFTRSSMRKTAAGGVRHYSRTLSMKLQTAIVGYVHTKNYGSYEMCVCVC
jgi:hypothetical protein